MFKEGFAQTSVFQLPLYKGSPNEGILQELTRVPLQQWTYDAISKGRVGIVIFYIKHMDSICWSASMVNCPFIQITAKAVIVIDELSGMRMA